MNDTIFETDVNSIGNNLNSDKLNKTSGLERLKNIRSNWYEYLLDLIIKR